MCPFTFRIIIKRKKIWTKKITLSKAVDHYQILENLCICITLLYVVTNDLFYSPYSYIICGNSPNWNKIYIEQLLGDFFYLEEMAGSNNISSIISYHCNIATSSSLPSSRGMKQTITNFNMVLHHLVDPVPFRRNPDSSF